MKRTLLLILCALLLLLCACASDKDPALGDYTAVAAEIGGKAQNVSVLYPGGVSIQLKDGGSATLTVNDSVLDGTWTLTGGHFELMGENYAYTGSLRNDVIVLDNVWGGQIRLTLRKGLGAGGTSLPATSLTLEQAIGDTMGVEDFTSPTVKLFPGMKLYGVLHMQDITQDGKVVSDSMQADIWGYFTAASDGNAIFELFDTTDFENANPLVSMYVKLYNDHIVPVIGTQDAWVGGRYLTAEDAKYFTAYLQNGALHFTYPYESEAYSCELTLYLRERGAAWDLKNDPFRPNGITAEDIEAAVNASAK